MYEIILLLTYAITSVFAFDLNAKDNMVLYWGQNSAGNQQRLSYYCESDAADIMILSFLYIYPGTDGVPGLNFANACETAFDNGLLKCDEIAEDIKTCQSLGKKVLLAMGGALGSYGFTNDDEATEFATTFWNYFMEGTTHQRPFGDAIIDGVNYDIENNQQTGYVAFNNKLMEYFASSSRQYYTSAAPQCPYPDAGVGDLLENSKIDMAYVQFYNNYCSIGSSFNWDTWSNYAKTISPNPDIKIYLGLPGSVGGAGSGYVDIDTVSNAITQDIGDDSCFGGVMLWDASQLWNNIVDGGKNYAEAIKSILN